MAYRAVTDGHTYGRTYRGYLIGPCPLRGGPKSKKIKGWGGGGAKKNSKKIKGSVGVGLEKKIQKKFKTFSMSEKVEI